MQLEGRAQPVEHVLLDDPLLRAATPGSRTAGWVGPRAHMPRVGPCGRQRAGLGRNGFVGALAADRRLRAVPGEHDDRVVGAAAPSSRRLASMAS